MQSMIDDRPLRELSAGQRSLVTVSQARSLAYTYSQLHRLTDGRRWDRVTGRVLRLVGSADCPEQRALIAILDAGTGAALGGASAAWWWGIPGNALEPFEIVRLRHRSRTESGTERRRGPKLLPSNHVVTLEGIPTLVPARTLFAIAGSRRRGAELPGFVARMERMVDNAWSARLVSGRTLHGMLDEVAERGRPGIRVMRQVLATRGLDYVPPASNLEGRAIKILEDGGVRTMRRQVDIGDEEGWIGRVDLRDAEVPLIIEVQSERFHSSLVDRQADAHRLEGLRRAGFVVVELTEFQVWHRPHEVLEAVLVGRQAAARLARKAG